MSSSSSFDEVQLSDSDVSHIEVPRSSPSEKCFTVRYDENDQMQLEDRYGNMWDEGKIELKEQIAARTDISEHAKEDLMIKHNLPVCTRFCDGCGSCQGLREGSQEKDYFIRDLPARCKKCHFRSNRCRCEKKKSKKVQVPKSRYFMLSIWDTSESMRKRIKSFESNPRVKKFVCQEEICPTTGRHHFQAYLALDNAYRTSWVHTLMDTEEKCGVKFADGNHVECYKYCTKEESRVEDGFSFEFGDFERKKPGKR